MEGTRIQVEYSFGGGRNAARDSSEFLFAMDTLQAASQTWIIKKPWIFESGLAMVLSRFPGQMTLKPSTT